MIRRFESHAYAKIIFAGIALFCAGMAWLVALQAIDSGSLLMYAIFFVFLGFGIQAVWLLFKSFRK